LLGVQIVITSLAFSASPSCHKQRIVMSRTKNPAFLLHRF
jgi:hypothetical protein